MLHVVSFDFLKLPSFFQKHSTNEVIGEKGLKGAALEVPPVNRIRSLGLVAAPTVNAGLDQREVKNLSWQYGMVKFR
jgi:hypothetical protein